MMVGNIDRHLLVIEALGMAEMSLFKEIGKLECEFNTLRETILNKKTQRQLFLEVLEMYRMNRDL